MKDLLKRARSGKVVVVDARPASEFAAGHIAGAISVPVDEAQAAARELPGARSTSPTAGDRIASTPIGLVELLRASGRRARRLWDGFPEWKAARLR
jgi:rhodanese-related sulfurtransferase